MNIKIHQAINKLNYHPIMKKASVILVLATLMLASCHNAENDFDAAGAFESVETIVSTEASGTIMQFNVEEGQVLKPNQFIGYVDSAQLYFRKQQLQAQLEEAEKNQQRMNNLFKANAATQQQLDDANTQVDVIKKQIEAQKSTLGI